MSANSDWYPATAFNGRVGDYAPAPPNPSVAFYPLKDTSGQGSKPRPLPAPAGGGLGEGVGERLRQLEERVGAAERSNQALKAEVEDYAP